MMTLLGVGGDGRIITLTLTDRDHQVSKELDPASALQLAARLIEEAMLLLPGRLRPLPLTGTLP
jgi:hypothetical protein